MSCYLLASWLNKTISAITYVLEFFLMAAIADFIDGVGRHA